MRVLHVIPSVAPRYGGPSTAIRGMTAALAAGGLDVTVASTDADGPGRLDVSLDRPVTESGVTYRYFSRSLPGEYKFSWPLTRWLRAHAEEFDVVHVHALFSYATVAACRMAARAGVPYLLRPLGTLGAWSLAHRGWKKAPYLALVERRHLRDAAALHATSDGEADALAALGYGDKTRVVPLGVPMLEGGESPTRVPRGTADGECPFRLLFLSRLHPVKNLPLLVDAVAALRATVARPVLLTIAGEGEASYVAELRARVEALGLAGQVQFVGRLEGAEKLAAFDAADLFVLPSSHENFGIAPDVARAHAGTVVPLDAAALTAAIAGLIGAPATLGGMRAAALGLARERYSWSGCAASLEALYGELANRRAAGL